MKTKVVHFSMNPSAVATQQRTEEVEKLRKENQALREKVCVLEQSGGSQSTGTATATAAEGSYEKHNPDTPGPSVVKQVQGEMPQYICAFLFNFVCKSPSFVWKCKDDPSFQL